MPKPFRSEEFWSNDLDYLLNVAPAALGQRGTTGAVVAACERSGAASCADHEWIIDSQIGWGKPGVDGVNHVARVRALEKFWKILTRHTRAILVVHYEPRQIPAGAGPYMYAADGRTSLSGVTLALCSPDERNRIASAAKALNDQPSRWASSGEGKQRIRTIRAMVERAIAPVLEAHTEWRELRMGPATAWATPATATQTMTRPEQPVSLSAGEVALAGHEAA